jgi:DNA-binding transcriptional ArsR family regulator
MRILQLCRQPSSVREIAERLGMPVTRLYYHTNLLEDAGFIEVVHTRKSGARIEKIYRVAGQTITPGPELLANVEDAGTAAKALAAIVVEPARAETEDALQRRFEGNEQLMHIGRAIAILTPAQIEDIESRISALIAECLIVEPNLDDPQARGYAFTYTLVPTDLG